MAENESDRNHDELSEEASPYRQEEFRRQGRVMQSRELAGLVVLLATGTALLAYSPMMAEQLGTLMQHMFRVDLAARLDFINSNAASNVLFHAMKVMGVIVVPVFGVAAVLGFLGSFAQVGSVFSLDPLEPKLERIDPIKGVMRFFSLRHFLDSLRLLVRAVAVGIVAYFLMKNEIFGSRRFILDEPAALIQGFNVGGKTIFFTLCGVLLVFAGFDFWLQRWEYNKSLRLTRKEQKEEHKEHEGDPLIKARIRSVQKEVARRRMMEAVKKADVVITNPTHIAIAVVYSANEMNAPKVVAKGADLLAQKIKQIAMDAGVPLVENVPLARALYKTVKVGKFVPRALYQAVAEVLAYVYRLKRAGKG